MSMLISQDGGDMRSPLAHKPAFPSQFQTVYADTLLKPGMHPAEFVAVAVR